MKGMTIKTKRIASLVLAVLMLMNLTVFVSAAEKVSAKLWWTENIEAGEWADASAGAVFNLADFAPGSEAVRYLKVENTGKRAISYALSFLSESGAGELADVVDVYYKNGASANTAVSDMTLAGTLAGVINGNAISDGKILPGTLADEGFYTGYTVVAVALKMKDDASIDYASEDDKKIETGEFSIKLTASECAYENYPSVDKFELAFPNTDKYIYRVGNLNAVALGSLFKELDGADIGNVTVQIEKIDEATDVDWTYTPNAVWTNSTIQFSGTGTVKVTIDDDDYANALSVNLEVINAENLTSIKSISSKDAVLLNDVTFSTFSVSNGRTLYGNGFKLHAPNDVSYSDWGEAFVDVENGTLDNCRIVCPNFSYQVLYQSNMKDDENPKQTDAFFYNVRAAVKMTGSSKIVNSYVSGGRVGVFATGGNPVIDNSTIYGGAAANIQVITVNNLLLKDATLIQKPIQANVHNSTDKLMGMSVYLAADASGAVSPVTLEGELVQYAWANEEYAKYAPDDVRSYISTILKEEQFKHQITYEDGVTRESLNLGFVALDPDLDVFSSPTPASTSFVTDNRTNKEAVPYLTKNVATYAAVSSYENTNGTDASFLTIPEYETGESANIPATMKYNDSADGVDFTTNSIKDGKAVSSLSVDLDTVGTYSFSFDKLVAEKFGRQLSYTVKDSSGNAIDKSAAITLTDSGVSDYVLEIADNVYYGIDGQVVSGRAETYSHPLTITATKTSIPEPEWVKTQGGTPLLVVKSKDSDWSCAIPALEGFSVKYYTSANNSVILDLATLTPTSTGKQNGTNNYWEYTDAKTGYKLKVTCGVIHEGKGVYGMPVVVNNGGYKMYFTISSTNGYVGTGTAARTPTITYEFTDPNGKTLTFSKTWQFNYADYKNGKQYSYSDFVNGTLKEASGSCVTGDTLVTLADGRAKRIDEITYNDQLLVWDFYKGEYAIVTPAVIFDHGYDNSTVIKLQFEDGAEIKVVTSHQFFDVGANSFVTISEDSVASLVGHEFIKMDEDGYKAVKLENYEISNEYIQAYGIITALHYNLITADMLSTDFVPEDCGLHYYFEVGEDMTFDKAKMEADIQKYGLYTYEDFEDYLTKEFFDGYNVKYMKVAVGKGQYTYQGILDLIQRWLVDSGDVVPMLSDESGIALMSDEVPAITIVSTGNSITSATYSVKATEMDANGDVTFTATGTAPTGYASFTIDGDTYYTVQLAPGETISVKFENLQNAKDAALAMTYDWGTSLVDGVAQDSLVADGTVIDFGELSKSIDGATVTLYNTTKYPVTTDVYLAIYDANGMVSAARSANFIVDGKTERTFAPELELPEGAYAKAFVWHVGTMIPVLNK